MSDEALGFADGVAIDGKVAFFDVGNGYECCYVPGASSLFGPGKDAGASLHSGSWVSFFILNLFHLDLLFSILTFLSVLHTEKGGSQNYYDAFTKNIDDFIYDDEDFTALFAAGNDGAYGDYTVCKFLSFT